MTKLNWKYTHIQKDKARAIKTGIEIFNLNTKNDSAIAANRSWFSFSGSWFSNSTSKANVPDTKEIFISYLYAHAASIQSLTIQHYVCDIIDAVNNKASENENLEAALDFLLTQPQLRKDLVMFHEYLPLKLQQSLVISELKTREDETGLDLKKQALHALSKRLSNYHLDFDFNPDNRDTKKISITIEDKYLKALNLGGETQHAIKFLMPCESYEVTPIENSEEELDLLMSHVPYEQDIELSLVSIRASGVSKVSYFDVPEEPISRVRNELPQEEICFELSDEHKAKMIQMEDLSSLYKLRRLQASLNKSNQYLNKAGHLEALWAEQKAVQYAIDCLEGKNNETFFPINLLEPGRPSDADDKKLTHFMSPFMSEKGKLVGLKERIRELSPQFQSAIYQYPQALESYGLVKAEKRLQASMAMAGSSASIAESIAQIRKQRINAANAKPSEVNNTKALPDMPVSRVKV